MPDPPVERTTSEPLVSASKPAGTTIRTEPDSPNAQAANVAKAGPTRTSLFDRGAPPGRSNVTRTFATWWKKSDDGKRTSSSE